jgi:hypothetical protein
MTAGDLYTIGDVGLSGSPSTAINMGNVAAASNGLSVDTNGNIAVGVSDGVIFVNEQASTLSRYGLSIPADSAAVVAGNAEGTTDCVAGATSVAANTQYFQSAEPTFDSSGNIYFADNEAGGSNGGGCDWVLPATTGILDGMSVTAGNVYKLAGNGGATATSSGLPAVQSNVAGTAEMTLDSAGNVVLAVQSHSGFGTSPAIQVLAESTGNYYGTAMTAGDLYTVAGGSSNTLATLSGPTSILNAGGGNLLFTDGSNTSANLDELSGAPTGGAVAGGTVTLSKSIALIGNYNDKVSGTGWNAHSDTTVTVNECASAAYSAATCDAANQVSATLGTTATTIGTFKNALIKLAVGTMDTNGDTCGLSGSPTCYIVVVGNTGDSTSSALAFTLPTFTVKKTTTVLGNYVDAVKATGIPIGDDVGAFECDGSVSVPATVSTHCDGATIVNGTASTSGAVVFPSGVKLLVGSAFTDAASGSCSFGGTCDIGIVDASNADIGTGVPVTFATPAITVKKTTAVLGNYVDGVKTSGFPIGDTVSAQECDSSVSVPATVSTHCDAATEASGTVAANGAVPFSPAGVKLLVGSAYSDGASGSCSFGGTCEIAVTDAQNSAIGLSGSVAFATPAITLKKTTAALGGSLDTVKAIGFPIGDTIDAQECDSSVSVPSTVSTNCDASTKISGTTGTTGVVVFAPTGVTLAEGGAYSDPAAGTVAAGGTAEIAVTDPGNSAVALEDAVSFATPAATVKSTSAVTDNFVDKVTATSFPIGDTVTALECDSNVNASNVGTNCDTATEETGTVGTTGVVTFTSTGVKVVDGGAYSDGASGTVVPGGPADIVINDSTHSGFFIAVPITMHS